MSGRSPGFSFHERGWSLSTSSADGDQSSISCLYRRDEAVIRMTPLPSILAFAVDEVLRPGLFVTTVLDDVTPLAVTDELNAVLSPTIRSPSMNTVPFGTVSFGRMWIFPSR